MADGRVRSRQWSDGEILEGSVRAVSEQLGKADDLIRELEDAGVSAEEGRMVAAKAMRAELLSLKAGLESELSEIVLSCARCDRDVRWIPSGTAQSGHWGHLQPAPNDHEPVV
jgi:hypothetical protein